MYIPLLLGIEINWNTVYLTMDLKQISIDLFIEIVYIHIRATGTFLLSIHTTASSYVMKEAVLGQPHSYEHWRISIVPLWQGALY
jgi:hypothetical protein